MNELSPEIRWKNDELDVLPETVAQEKLHQYHSLRRFLCHFLMTYTDTAPFFEQIGLQVAPFLIEESRAWLEELMVEGQEIIAEALTIAQKLLYEQETLPFIDPHLLDRHEALVEVGLLLPLPITSSEDQAHFVECLALLREWHQDLVAFLQEQRQEQS